ncbi:hypothetical protein PVA44_00505 [Entomospira nematocerorum]|uniref:Uncharacterized protein n=1 Tax=Entomospira nematocerorum TaxID=2719987 RepID=A0A968KUN6_9SPIO|nr:hypothetical protein [Entomospira nematocera]NIZ47479.1 hypothetical protein [Entomospira nematocera]WDI33981.1 hypothetical protein PVA44_00505 [Entomospira nematocera]
MTYCRRCRIIINSESTTHCPLCDQILIHHDSSENPETLFYEWGNLKKAHEHPSFWHIPMPISSKKVINTIFDFLMMGAFSAILIVLTVSIYAGNPYHLDIYIPIVSLFYSIVMLAIIRFYRFSLGAQWLMLLNTALFLIGIDLKNKVIEWSTSSGLLIIFGGVGPFLILQILWRYLKIKGLNMIAFIFLAISIALLSLDASLNGGVRLQGWSLFTFSTLLFFALLFLHLHYIAKIRVNFVPILQTKRDKGKDKL